MHAKHADSEWLTNLSARVIHCAFTTGLQHYLLLKFGKRRLEIKRVAHGL